MKVWATYEEYMTRHPSDKSSKDSIEAAIGDAAAIISAALDDAGISYENIDDDSLFRTNLRIVTCAMAARMVRTASSSGIKQESQMVGQLQQSYTYESPSGSMYLTSAEKSMLGITAAANRGAQVFYGSDILGG